ncbi:unnamed protein product [Lymnaea stagnalis]|uniref:Ig-like domain-containing protein n=1 Tax=Lymnaea stagnalis TaxID=6523 RepID=A0AAV2HQW1_LYMST
MHWRISKVIKLLCILLCFDLNVAQWIPAGTAQSFTFTSPNITQTFPIVWYTYPQKSKLFICTENNATCVPFTNTVLETYTANKTSNSTSYISTFTIKTVTPLQHDSRWLCQAEFQDEHIESKLYNLRVYAVPQTPTCDKVSLLNESNINIKCMTDKVFPGSICVFYIITNQTSPSELKYGQLSYAHQQDNATGYYKTRCTYTISANFIGPGTHTFNVIMYPDITSNILEEMKRISDYSTPITIGYPKAALGTDCYLKDYIKENETSTCTCYDNNTSFLPTQVTWSTGDSNNGTLHFIVRRPSNTEPSFQCVVSNNLNFTNVIIYQPRVAYPPDMSLTLKNVELDLCLDKKLDIIGSCFVSESYPASAISIYINNVLLDANHFSNTLDHTFNSSYQSSGVVNVTCLAYNVAFSVSKTQYLTIKGPPERPNIFQLVRQGTDSSSEKTQLSIIMCQSAGGVPYSKQLSLTCGTMEAYATNSDTVILQVNVMRTPTDVNCTCVVLHESKCLQNKTTEFLRLYHMDDSSPVEINSAAIAVGVTLGLGLLLSISVNIFIIRRYKRFKRGDSSTKRSNTKKTQEYIDIGATPYVNTELHSYETANVKPIYSNEATSPPPSQRVDKLNITHHADKEDHPYDEVTELKK